MSQPQFPDLITFFLAAIRVFSSSFFLAALFTFAANAATFAVSGTNFLSVFTR